MLINFHDEKERVAQGMNGGTGDMYAKMHIGEHGKIILSRLPCGSSIGLHKHRTSDDINYVLSGVGIAICDGVEERLFTGVCHVCPKGTEHAIVNTGSNDLCLLTVVVER